MILLNTYQTIFLIIVPVVVILVIFFVSFYFIRKALYKKNFRYNYYKKIYKYVLYNDFYLINDFSFEIDDNVIAKIDHIVFGNKYIFVINDYYYDGDISGKQNDPSFIFVSRKGKKCYTDNPMLLNMSIVKKLAGKLGVSPSLMIGIVVINNNSHIQVKIDSKDSYLIQIKNLPSLIRAIESRNISSINEKQLAHAVKVLDKINITNK